MRKVEFYIKGELPNLNDYTKANRTNRYAGAEMKKRAETLIRYNIMSQVKNRVPMKRAFVIFKWYEKNRMRDPDNVAFAKKFILDAMVSTGILQGDGWKNIAGFQDFLEVDARNPRIEVVVIER